MDVEIARTPDELERLRPLWETVSWEREEAELDYLLARVRLKPAWRSPGKLRSATSSGTPS